MSSGTRGALIGGVVVFGLAGAWFSMSYLIMNTSVSDAFGESLGVGLGLLMVASVVGAIRSHSPTDQSEQSDRADRADRGQSDQSDREKDPDRH